MDAFLNSVNMGRYGFEIPITSGPGWLCLMLVVTEKFVEFSFIHALVSFSGLY